MAATRSVKRDNRGRFAGANGGTKVTIDKSGGFANAAFRTRVQQSRLARQSSPVRSARAARARVIAGKIARNKHVQKAAVHLVVAGGVGVATHTNPATGIRQVVKQVVSVARPSGSKSSIHINKSGGRKV